MRATLLLVLVLSGACQTLEPAESSHSPSSESQQPPLARVRIMTWNIALLDEPGSDAYRHMVDIIRHIDPDYVAINEVSDDERQTFLDLARDLGYDTAFLPADNPFGDWRNALMTRLPVVELGAPTSRALSGDPDAEDVTRLPIVGVVSVPQTDVELRIVGQHLKAGWEDIDWFRRAVDAQRTAQAAGGGERLIVLGDLNADIDQTPHPLPVWTTIPRGSPPSYSLGADMVERLDTGLPNDAFAPFLDLDLSPLYASQVDGTTGTRPTSGRRIDWILTSEDLIDVAEYEVYNSYHGELPGLPKPGPLPEFYASDFASDHLPVFVDLTFPQSE